MCRLLLLAGRKARTAAAASRGGGIVSAVVIAGHRNEFSVFVSCALCNVRAQRHRWCSVLSCTLEKGVETQGKPEQRKRNAKGKESDPFDDLNSELTPLDAFLSKTKTHYFRRTTTTPNPFPIQAKWREERFLKKQDAFVLYKLHFP